MIIIIITCGRGREKKEQLSRDRNNCNQQHCVVLDRRTLVPPIVAGWMNGWIGSVGFFFLLDRLVELQLQ